MSKHPLVFALVPGALALLVSACGAAPQTPAPATGLKSDVATAAVDTACRESKELRPTGGDDTALLQAALDQCVPGGRDCKVRLGAGTFKTTQLVTTGFHGTLVGDGMHATVIEPFGILDVNQYDGEGGAWGVPPSEAKTWPSLISFLGDSDVRVEDLTVRVTEFNPTHGYWNWGAWATYLTVEIFVWGGSAHFDRVSFEGAAGTDGAVNVDDGPVVQGPSPSAVVEMKRCRFTNITNPFELMILSDARITVGGSPDEGNVFEHAAGGAFVSLDGGEVRYSHNRISSDSYLGGLFLWNTPDPRAPQGTTAPTRFFVRDNQISVTSDYGVGVYAEDDFLAGQGIKSMELVVDHNRIDVDSGDPANMWGIEAYADDSVFAHNRITGFGREAILQYGGGCLIEHNDLTGFTASKVPILLTAQSHDCTVIVKDASTVLDKGTNNHVVVKP